jgi:hypothetical protein
MKSLEWRLTKCGGTFATKYLKDVIKMGAGKIGALLYYYIHRPIILPGSAWHFLRITLLELHLVMRNKAPTKVHPNTYNTDAMLSVTRADTHMTLFQPRNSCNPKIPFILA